MLEDLTTNRAKQEFFVSKSLVEYGCPSIVPIRVYEYMNFDMRFSSNKRHPESLGVVVTGLLESNSLRADSIFDYETLDENCQKEIDVWIRHLSCCDSRHPSLCLITKLSKLFGKTIRKFSEAGFFRYSGAPDNYSYCSVTGEVFLIDLDSSLKICELSPIEKSLQIIRDASSGVAYLIAFLTHPNRLNSFPMKEVIEYNPFRELLSGYYHDVDKELINNVSYIITKYYQKVFAKASTMIDDKAYKKSNNIRNDFQCFLSQSFMRPWIDRKETYSYLMPITWLLHEKSALMNSVPHKLSINQVFERIAKYNSSNQVFERIAKYNSSLTANSISKEINPFL